MSVSLRGVQPRSRERKLYQLVSPEKIPFFAWIWMNGWVDDGWMTGGKSIWVGKRIYMRFEVLTAVRMTMFWVVAPCRLVGRYQRLGETHCLHLQPWRWKQYVYPKRWYLPTSLHGVISQKNYIVKYIHKWLGGLYEWENGWVGEYYRMLLSIVFFIYLTKRSRSHISYRVEWQMVWCLCTLESTWKKTLFKAVTQYSAGNTE
jgi:hypothetical protein